MRAEVKPPILCVRTVALRVAAAAALAAAVYYLWVSLAGYGVELSAIVDRDYSFYLFVCAGSILYGAGLCFLALAWVAFLPSDATRGSVRKLLKVYGISSSAKYLPSGLLHFGGRQLGGARLGLSHRAIAAASLLEAGTSAALAVLLAALIYFTGVAILIPVAVASGAAALWFFARRSSFRDGAAAGAALTFLFMAVMAALAAACAMLAGADVTPRLAASAYLAAWAAGFVIPGLSAGIGVREAAFAFLVSGGVITPEIAAVGLFMRVLTTLGDAIFFTGFLSMRAAGGEILRN